MKPIESPTKFTAFTKASGVTISDCTLSQGIDQMLSFYESVMPHDCINDEGDMLLFQCGTYDWGNGKHFELNVTRQFIECTLKSDDAISQLSLTFKFEPTPELQSVGEVSRWCTGLQELDGFRTFIFSSAPFLTACSREVKRIELSHSYV